MDKLYSVLIADDSTACRDAFREALRPEGYEVVPAGSGREAIDVIRREPIHVVVMEVHLPDYSGVEIYHAIKEIREVFLPCIFTAHEMTRQSLEAALSEDAVTVLPKPVDVSRLVRAVARAIDRYYASGVRSAGLEWPRGRNWPPFDSQ